MDYVRTLEIFLYIKEGVMEANIQTHCVVCRSVSGKERISSGPVIHSGKFWIVEHVHPPSLLGWLVIVCRRHVESLHELTAEEFREFSEICYRVIRGLHLYFHCEKEYVAIFAEMKGFHHLHAHVIPRRKTLPPQLRGAKIFSLLKKNREECCDPSMVEEFSLRFKQY